MKKNLFFTMLAAATLTGFTACSSDDSVENGPGVGEVAEKYISVNIRSVGATPTRAGDSYNQGDGKYEDGEGQESAINKIYFYFFDTNGNPYNVNVDDQTGTNVPGGDSGNRYAWTSNIKDGDPSEDHSITVEKITDAKIVLHNPSNTLKSLVAVVNPTSDTDFPATMTKADIQKVLGTPKTTADYESDVDGKSYFLMTNSVYQNAKGSGIDIDVPTEGHVASKEEDALDNPVEIYVERVAAKVRVEAGYTTTGEATSKAVTRDENGVITTTEGGRWTNVYETTAGGIKTYSANSSEGAVRYDAYRLLDKSGSTNDLTYKVTLPAEGGGTATTEDCPVYAVIFGWGIADGAKNAYIFKDITGSAGFVPKLGFTPWSTADYHRSFWEVIPTYARFQKGASHDAGGYTWNDYTSGSTKKVLGGYTYTMPNTKQMVIDPDVANRNGSATTNTKVVLAAKLMYKDGDTFKPLTRVRYMATDYFSEDAVKNIVLSGLKNIWYRNSNAEEWRNLSTSDLTFETAAGTTDKTTESIVTRDKNYEVTLKLANTISETGQFGRGETNTGVTVLANGFNTVKTRVESNKALVYNEGMTYYYTTLRHLGTDKAEYAYFGVVRNHLYDVTITGIAGWGTPVYDPDIWVVPETPTDNDTYLAARINVLSWRVVPQSVDIDGTAK